MTASYPKLLRVGTPLVENIFNEDVVISEKFSGSMCRICMTKDYVVEGSVVMEGYVVVGSKNHRVADHNRFKIAHEQGYRIYTETDWRNLGDNITLFCEFLSSPKHNTIKYDRVPLNHLYLFGAIIDGVHMKTDDLFEIADVVGIDPPNIMYTGKVESVDDLKEFMTHQSYLGGSVVEGVVVTNYHRSYDPLHVHDNAYIGYPMAAKFDDG